MEHGKVHKFKINNKTLQLTSIQYSLGIQPTYLAINDDQYNCMLKYLYFECLYVESNILFF